VRKGTGEGGLPPVVLSLPPSWTFLRQVELPVEDIGRAKKIHVAELEGNLPIEDEEILSDLLPSPPGAPGRFLAIASRRGEVEKAVKIFSEAGFPLDRVVTDHVSILSAALSGENGADGILLSTLSDIVVLRVDGGTIRWARQLPGAMAKDDAGLASQWREILAADPFAAAARRVTVLGEVPPVLAAELSGASRLATPPGVSDDTAVLAYGAALAPSLSSELAGFSLRTSAEAESALETGKRRIRIAAVAIAVALLSALAALETARWAEAKKVASIRAQIRKEFAEAVPGTKAGAQDTVQIRERIQSLRRQQKELGTDSPALSVLLMKVSQALPAKEDIAIREISVDAGRIRLTGEAGAAPLVESYRAALASALGPEAGVTVQESQGGGKTASIRFTILIETGGAGRAS
jgi:hypothetical protein